MDTTALFLSLRRPVCEVDQLLPYNAEDTNEWSCTSIRPYTCMTISGTSLSLHAYTGDLQ